VNGKHVARVAVHNLYFDGARERLAHGGHRIGVNEQACVAAFMDMAPLQFQYVIFVLLLRSQDAGRDSRTDDYPIADRPCLRRAVDVHPAVEVLVVEQRHEPLVTRLQGGGAADDNDYEK
jgi:hypothetical protein